MRALPNPAGGQAVLIVADRLDHRLIHRQKSMGIAGNICIGYSRCMEQDSALEALAALSHPTRLDAFRLLVRHEPVGLPTGALVEASGLSQSTFSTHLAVLARAGLVSAEKRGRHQIQRARIDTLRVLMTFLAKDCCLGSPELCEPLLADLTCC
jgi:DNA-binding transcriptional ArsR family regulator